MPADIRSFFGGKAAAPKQESQPAKSDKARYTVVSLVHTC